MQKKFQRIISLRDGSGAQVFKAEHQDQLVNEIILAYLNALKKIKKQEAQLKKFRQFKLQTKEK